jgi:hypothetical protein
VVIAVERPRIRDTFGAATLEYSVYKLVCAPPTRQPSATSSDAPLIRVSGFAVIAGVVEDTLGERRKLLGQ